VSIDLAIVTTQFRGRDHLFRRGVIGARVARAEPARALRLAATRRNVTVLRAASMRNANARTLARVKYNYECPGCGKGRRREWADREKSMICSNKLCKAETRTPAPADDWDAWVDQHDPPDEMAEAAYQINDDRDGLCTVPDCEREPHCLDHRIPYDDSVPPEMNSGKTRVANLYPMCTEHNVSKGRRNYWTWLLSGDAEDV
jgi:hypothetical protein